MTHDYWTSTVDGAAGYEVRHHGVPADGPDPADYAEHRDDTHVNCEWCSAELCDDCDHLGGVAACVSGAVHCEDDVYNCRECGEESSRTWWDA